MSFKVRWTNPCHIDGEYRSYGFCETDVLNDLGLKRWVLCFPRGKDGKGSRMEEVTYTMKGVKGSLTHPEMVTKLKEMGLWEAPK